MMPLVLKNYLKISFEKVKEMVSRKEKGLNDEELEVGVCASTIESEDIEDKSQALSRKTVC